MFFFKVNHWASSEKKRTLILQHTMTFFRQGPWRSGFPSFLVSKNLNPFKHPWNKLKPNLLWMNGSKYLNTASLLDANISCGLWALPLATSAPTLPVCTDPHGCISFSTLAVFSLNRCWLKWHHCRPFIRLSHWSHKMLHTLIRLWCVTLAPKYYLVKVTERLCWFSKEIGVDLFRYW